MRLYDVANGWGYELRETDNSFVAVYKNGRSWEAKTFTDLYWDRYQRKTDELTELNRILDIDPDAVIINSGCYGFYPSQTVKEVLATLKECLKDSYYRLDKFLADYWKGVFRRLDGDV